MESIYEGGQSSNRREIERINTYLAQILVLVNNRYRRKEIRKELQDNLEDEMQELISEGYSLSKAVSYALKDMGRPEEIAQGYNSVYAPYFDWGKMLTLWIGTIFTMIFLKMGVNFGQLMFFFNTEVSRIVGILLMIVAGFTFCWEELNELPFLYGVGGFNVNSAIQNLIALAIMNLSLLHTFELCVGISLMMIFIKKKMEKIRVQFERKYIFSTGQIYTIKGCYGIAEIACSYLRECFSGKSSRSCRNRRVSINCKENSLKRGRSYEERQRSQIISHQHGDNRNDVYWDILSLAGLSQ